MSWLFSQALVAEYLRANCLDGDLCAQSKSTGSVPTDSCSDKTKGALSHSQSGTMCKHSTAAPGEDLLTWFLAASPAPTFPRQERKPESKANPADSGSTWQESFAMYDRDSCLWKIRQLSLIEDSEPFLATWPKWGSLHGGECWDLTMLAPHTPDPVVGSWPTPCHGSSRWGGTFQEVGGSQNKLRGTPTGKLYVNPDFWESLMGWPIGWTGTAPLATDKIREWQQQHSPSCPDRSDVA